MVSALRFKGDPKKSKKRKTAPTDASSASKSSKATADDLEGWTSATSAADLKGPLTFSRSGLLLSSDPLGVIFTSPTSSDVDVTPKDEDGESAVTVIPKTFSGEPTTVQQVFTLAPIYGSDPAAGKFSIRSHVERYVSVDKTGTLTATREAIGPQETLTIVRTEDGWSVQTWSGKYVGVDEKGDVRGDYEDVQTWGLGCQRRFKVTDDGGSGAGVGVVVKEKIGRRELERLAGVELDDEQVRKLRRAKREGDLNEALLDVRVKKGKHDKFAY